MVEQQVAGAILQTQHQKTYAGFESPVQAAGAVAAAQKPYTVVVLDDWAVDSATDGTPRSWEEVVVRELGRAFAMQEVTTDCPPARWRAALERLGCSKLTALAYCCRSEFLLAGCSSYQQASPSTAPMLPLAPLESYGRAGRPQRLCRHLASSSGPLPNRSEGLVAESFRTWPGPRLLELPSLLRSPADTLFFSADARATFFRSWKSTCVGLL
jgi:hypothetical protein